MKELSPGKVLATKVAARIREFRVARGLSLEQLGDAAALSSDERLSVELGNEELTVDIVKRIARVFDVHPAVLFMSPDEDAFAGLLEPYRDLPKDQLQKIAGELLARGYRRSRGSA